MDPAKSPIHSGKKEGECLVLFRLNELCIHVFAHFFLAPCVFCLSVYWVGVLNFDRGFGSLCAMAHYSLPTCDGIVYS